MTVLISASQLADALAQTRDAPTERLVVLDVRWQLGGPPGRSEYDRGHLPGAVFVDLDQELAGPPGPAGRHPLPDPAVFGAAMRRAGVSAGSTVVVHDAGQGWAAARAWWLLRWAGHPRVRVLDGGLAAWRGPLTTVTPQPAEGDFLPRPGALPVLDAEGAARTAREGVLLDARAPERYRGEVEPVDPVAGHIPGAVSAPTVENTEADGTLRPAETLAARFASLGVSPGTRAGVYCGSGVSAAHQVLALAVAGVEAALYAGSWSEWCAAGTRPVATGPEPGPAGG
ncbi:sulfurtransferase [Streptomyces sp. ACA25]|uniref:sulfurtransferase n=1 Tax=Streptomyces sp. ACA25 TaxID=3022596 RepID=UPI002307A805|nr:sulfurtransferase [Streptomyces sp. ACA25]MDB1088805.1 sulfurtransferase [Streptomyces sp. ACA25]